MYFRTIFPKYIRAPRSRVPLLGVMSALLLAACLMMQSATNVSAQEKSDEVTNAMVKAIDEIERASKMTPELKKRFESGEIPDPEVLVPIAQRLKKLGLGPLEYCCHNNGTCDCEGIFDCGAMFSAKCKQGTISCPGGVESDACTCEEKGPTFCPFENCCTDNTGPFD